MILKKIAAKLLLALSIVFLSSCDTAISISCADHYLAKYFLQIDCCNSINEGEILKLRLSYAHGYDSPFDFLQFRSNLKTVSIFAFLENAHDSYYGITEPYYSLNIPAEDFYSPENYTKLNRVFANRPRKCFSYIDFSLSFEMLEKYEYGRLVYSTSLSDDYNNLEDRLASIVVYYRVFPEHIKLYTDKNKMLKG